MIITISIPENMTAKHHNVWLTIKPLLSMKTTSVQYLFIGKRLIKRINGWGNEDTDSKQNSPYHRQNKSYTEQ